MRVILILLESEELKELLEIADKYKLSSLSTDNSNESISILANTYMYKCSNPYFKVESPRNAEQLRERIINYINTEVVMGKKLIDIIEDTLYIGLSKLRKE